jgi:hypothetical protein
VIVSKEKDFSYSFTRDPEGTCLCVGLFLEKVALLWLLSTLTRQRKILIALDFRVS